MAPTKMNQALSVLVLDDDQQSASEWKEALEAGSARAKVDIKVEALSDRDLDEIADDLYARSIAFRNGKEHPSSRDDLDKCDLLFIDADLRGAPGARLASGKELAYSVRCFTEAGPIAVLNADGENSFDLSLYGDRKSFGDIHLGSDQLSNPGLWKMSPDEDFRPWDWPLLASEAARYKRRLHHLLTGQDFERPITDLLGFSPADIEALPPDAASFLTTEQVNDETPIGDLTLLDFVTKSEFAFLRKDSKTVIGDPERYRSEIARVAASRLPTWVNRVVLPAQDTFVDAPHLALRFPSVLDGPPDRIESFSKTVRLDLNPGASDDELLKELGFQDYQGELAANRFNASLWTDRPLWWGRGLNKSDLQEANEPWEYVPPAFVFCEDASRFLAEDQAETFSCKLETPYRLRYIAKHPDVVYRHRERFLQV